jgi:hypothetical protein
MFTIMEPKKTKLQCGENIQIVATSTIPRGNSKDA